MYHGPRDDIHAFFEQLGFRCPERKGFADFLQEVTSRKDQKVPYCPASTCLRIRSACPIYCSWLLRQGVHAASLWRWFWTLHTPSAVQAAAREVLLH